MVINSWRNILTSTVVNADTGVARETGWYTSQKDIIVITIKREI